VLRLRASQMSDADALSSISLKQLAALYVSDALSEEIFLQLASKFFSSARPLTSGKSSKMSSRPSSATGKLNASVVGNGTGYAHGVKGHLAAFSAGTASPQLRQIPMNDRDRYLFSMDLQNMFVLLRVPNMRESDAVRALACLDPVSVHRCIEQLRRCRSTGSELTRQSRPMTPSASRPSSLTDEKYNSPVWQPAAAKVDVPAKSNALQAMAVHVVRKKGVEDSAVFPARSANQPKRSSGAALRPASAPTSSISPRLWKSGGGATPRTPALQTQRSYALTHRDQVARDVVNVIGWLGDVAIDTTSPASLTKRKAQKDFRVAHAVPAERTHGNFVQKSAKTNGLLSQQSNTTSVVIKALQHERAKGTPAAGRTNRLRGESAKSASGTGFNPGSKSSASNWVQSDARFNMHQRRRLLLQQLL
jgi:hypothetical protein